MIFNNLKEIEQKEIIPGYKARFIHSENMTLAYWEIKKDAKLPEHAHPNEQVANVIEGKFELKVGDETKVLGKEDVAVIPPDVKHSGKAVTDCKIIDVFYPIRGDYK
jgi:quercetin dioxygenase-like cupin family protein